MSTSSLHERIIPNLRRLDPQSMRNCIQLLAREHGFLENIFNTIGEGIVVIDNTLHILYHNAAAKSMLGLPDELSKLTMNKVLKGLNWEGVLQKRKGGKRDDRTKIMRQELELSYPKRRIVQFYTLPVAGDDSRYVLIFNDVTAMVDQAVSTAEDERSRMVSMLAAGVAHEIGNPLNSLYLHLQFLQALASTFVLLT